MEGPGAPRFCCEEFRSAVEVTFAMPVHGPTGWLLYGTDAETVSAGLPELRYWAARFCPFCGAPLRPYPGALPRGRVFGFAAEAETPGVEPESDGTLGQTAPRTARRSVSYGGGV
jgi:hypothetical protein